MPIVEGWFLFFAFFFITYGGSRMSSFQWRYLPNDCVKPVVALGRTMTCGNKTLFGWGMLFSPTNPRDQFPYPPDSDRHRCGFSKDRLLKCSWFAAGMWCNKITFERLVFTGYYVKYWGCAVIVHTINKEKSEASASRRIFPATKILRIFRSEELRLLVRMCHWGCEVMD